MKLIAQGDVLIVKVDTVPRKAKRIAAKQGRLILAEGEATGHSHSIAATEDVELMAVADQVDLWLRVRSRSVQVEHQEHGTITLEPGDYRVVRQREYQPDQIRRVAD